jgi:hypothetical protein
MYYGSRFSATSDEIELNASWQEVPVMTWLNPARSNYAEEDHYNENDVLEAYHMGYDKGQQDGQSQEVCFHEVARQDEMQRCHDYIEREPHARGGVTAQELQELEAYCAMAAKIAETFSKLNVQLPTGAAYPSVSKLVQFRLAQLKQASQGGQSQEGEQGSHGGKEKK